MNLLTSIIRYFFVYFTCWAPLSLNSCCNMLLSRQEQPHNIVAGNTLLIRGRGQSQNTALIFA